MDKTTVDFYDAHAAEQAALYETADMSAMYKRISSLLPQKGSIFEIGCGSGRDAQALADLGFSVVATDASNGMIREAKKHHEEKQDILSFACLPFPIPQNHPVLENRYDLVLAVAVLMHILPEDRLKALTQISQLLKPQRWFYCSFKNQANTDQRQYYPISVTDLIRDCDNVGLRVWQDESSQDILGRKTIWTTLIFKKTLNHTNEYT